jgi:RNA polymerase sigma factor (sigma-70 family)
MTRDRTVAAFPPWQSLLEAGSMTGMTDSELVERFAKHRDAAGDAAFGVLVARHGAMVLGVCRHILADAHAAEDAFQAVFLVLARRAGSIRRPDLLGPWLHGVSVRIARKARVRVERRRHRETMEGDMTDVESPGDGPDPRPIRTEEAAAVHEEVGRLPERYRRAVVLCHFEGLTHAEAARRLGCAPGTVGSLVSRARDLLRGRLARRGLSASALIAAGSLEPRTATAAVPPALERATIRAALTYATAPAAAAGIASATAVELAGTALRTAIVGRLAAAGALMLTLGLVATAAGGLAAGSFRAHDPRPARPRVQEKVRDGAASLPPPSIPGAVSRPPAWLVNVAPFDVAAFFAAPSDEENAAPRYLDALFEFGRELEVCFPEGPDRESRKRAADERAGRFIPVFQAWRNNPASVPAARIDAVVAEYDTGFRKLDWAQRRPQCVFETGIGVTARIPHAQAAGQVGRVARLKVRRELERGEIEAALRDLARLLRLSRDLRPRGVMIVDIAAGALDQAAVDGVVGPMLAAPGLSAAHCDRLLALLSEHESRSVDPYSEGLRAEYLSHRTTLHDLVHDQARLRKEWESIGGRVGGSIVAEVAEPMLISAQAPGGGAGAPLQGLAFRPMALRQIPDLDARIARTTPEELSQQVVRLSELYRGLLERADAPCLEQIRRSGERPRSFDAVDLHTRVTRGMLPATTAFAQVVARGKAMIRAAEGAVLVRRWQLRHDGAVPPTPEAAAKEAGLASVPIDPYDGRPIRFAVVDGRPTVYAIGQDGRDDGGRVDNARTPDVGDVVVRLPAP